MIANRNQRSAIGQSLKMTAIPLFASVADRSRVHLNKRILCLSRGFFA